MVQTYNAICRYACFVWALDSAVEGLLDELDEVWKKKYGTLNFIIMEVSETMRYQNVRCDLRKNIFLLKKLAFCKEYYYSTISCLRFKEEDV